LLLHKKISPAAYLYKAYKLFPASLKITIHAIHAIKTTANYHKKPQTIAKIAGFSVAINRALTTILGRRSVIKAT
jgi:hypothetical protein